jgi:ABC-2 type transport system permease protein
MTSIISADFFKLRKNIALWLLPVAAIVATLVTAVFIRFSDGATIEGGGEVVSAQDIFGFDTSGSVGVNAMSTISQLYAILGVIFAGLFISNEYSNGTIRNALCIGKSRVQVYLSKLLTACGMMLIVTFSSLVAFIGSLTLLYGFGDGTGFFTHTLQTFAMQLIYHLVFAALACMLAFLIPNIVFSVSVGIFVIIMLGVLTEICTAFDGLGLFARLLPNYYITRLTENLSNVAFITQGALASLLLIAAMTAIGCAVLQRHDIR